MNEIINLFYIGEIFYVKSRTMMSSIYTVLGERYDWGFVRRALDEGKTVIIRPADKVEMKWANDKLNKLKRR